MDRVNSADKIPAAGQGRGAKTCANVALKLCANDKHFCAQMKTAQMKFLKNVRKCNSTDSSQKKCLPCILHLICPVLIESDEIHVLKTTIIFIHVSSTALQLYYFNQGQIL